MIELKYGTRRVINFRGAKKVVGGLTDKNKIDVLIYVSKELANVGKEEDLFNTVINLCKEIFECSNSTLRLFDGELLVPVKYYKETTPPRRNLVPGEGYSGKTYLSAKPLLIDDLKRDPNYLDEFETTQSVMCVPINYREEKMGTLSVESDTAHFYKEDDLEILEALGAQLALALNGVRLIEGLMTARAREAAVLSQLEWDLKMGRNVQSQIIPRKVLPWNGIHFSSYYDPMVEVSGDYFSIARTGNALTLIIVDVSGHGIPAALVTMAIHYKFHRCVEQGLGLTEIMEEMGESLKPQLPESTYFTAFILRIYNDHTFSYTNGGHQCIIHFKKEGTLEALDTRGMPLGILDVKKNDYEEKQSKLEPGDLLLFYTDGIPEQKNKNRQEYSKERFISILKENYNKFRHSENFIGDKLLDICLKDFQEFKENASKGDDVTLLVLECNPAIDDLLPLVRMSKEAYKLKRTSDSLHLAVQAYKIEPSLKDNLLFLGKLCYNIKNYGDSAKYIEEYIKSSGEDTSIVHFLHAKALFKNEKYIEAKRSLKKSLSCDPSFVKASLLLAKCYLIENSLPKAIKTLQQGIKLSPESDPLKAILQRLETLKISEKLNFMPNPNKDKENVYAS